MSSATLTIPSTSSTAFTLPVSRQPANRKISTPSPSSWSKPRPVVGGHRDPVNGVAWSSDGKRIVSCSQGDKGIRVWDVGQSGSTSAPFKQLVLQLDPRHSQLLASPYTYNSIISKVEFDPSHVSELASIGGKGADSRICWWDVRTPSKPVSSLKPPFQPFQMSHHPTERVVAVSDIKEVITFYDQRMLPSTPSAAAKPLATTAGESMEGVEEEEKKLGWAASETYTYPDTQAYALKGAKVVVYDISFSATGSDLLVALGSGQVVTRPFASLAKSAEETKDSASTYQFNAHSGSINVLEVDKSGKYIATAGVDAIVNLWDTDGLIGLKSFGDMTGEGKHLSFSHDGEMLAAGGGDEPGVYVFSTSTESLIHKIPTGGSILSLAFSPKNDVLAYASNERTSSGGFSIVSMLPTN